MTHCVRLGPTAFLAAAFVLSFTSTRTVSAADTFRFRWKSSPAPSICPSPEKLAREVAAKLHRDPFDDAASSEISGSIKRQGDSWVVRIAEIKNGKPVFTDESSPIKADDCADAHALAVHEIAVFIQTGRLGLAPLPLTEAPSPPVPSIMVLPSQTTPAPLRFAESPRLTLPGLAAKPVSSSSTIPTGPRWDSHFFLGAGAAFGILPSIRPGFSMSGGLGHKNFEIDASLLFLPAATSETHSFALGLTAGNVGACARAYPRKRLALLGCANIVVGAMHAYVTKIGDGQDLFETIHPGDQIWAAMSIAPRLRFVIAAPLTLQIGADVTFPFTAYRLLADQNLPTERELFAQSIVTVIPSVQIGMTNF